METFVIPSEEDIKRWVKEAVEDSFKGLVSNKLKDVPDEPLLIRQEAAKFLHVTVGTLSVWTKEGLPHYRQKGRVYYTQSALISYLKTNRYRQLMSGRFAHLGEMVSK